jgi:hypothetical protein
MTLQHKFVESVPELMEQGVLYVSIPYCTVMHLCVCGCGNEVVTRISPTDWQLKFDGESISLSPSIGNWSFDCQSHYWIVKNEVQFARKWTDSQIENGRASERKQKEKRYADQAGKSEQGDLLKRPGKRKSRLKWLKSFFGF